jgi:hypothetical protein
MSGGRLSNLIGNSREGEFASELLDRGTFPEVIEYQPRFELESGQGIRGDFRVSNDVYEVKGGYATMSDKDQAINYNQLMEENPELQVTYRFYQRPSARFLQLLDELHIGYIEPF